MARIFKASMAEFVAKGLVIGMTDEYYIKEGILYCDEASDCGKSIDTHAIGPCKELIHKPPCCENWRNLSVYYFSAAHDDHTFRGKLKFCNDCGKPLNNG